MKILVAMVAMSAMLCSAVFAQTDYTQMEAVNIVVKPDNVDLFKKGMAAHNKKFHAADPYKANVRINLTGPAAGSYIWVMGPTTWTQMDNRPGKGEHDTDWDKNVVAYTESVSPPNYWRWVKDVNYDPAPGKTMKMSRARFNAVRPGQMDRTIELMKKIAATNKSIKSTSGFSMAIKQGATRGSNMITFNSFDKWAWFDEDRNFMNAFEGLYGEGSWDRWLEELDMCFDRVDTYDSISELLPELGG